MTNNSEPQTLTTPAQSESARHFDRKTCPNFSGCGYCPKHQELDACPLLLEFYGILTPHPSVRLINEDHIQLTRIQQ